MLTDWLEWLIIPLVIVLVTGGVLLLVSLI